MVKQDIGKERETRKGKIMFIKGMEMVGKVGMKLVGKVDGEQEEGNEVLKKRIIIKERKGKSQRKWGRGMEK